MPRTCSGSLNIIVIAQFIVTDLLVAPPCHPRRARAMFGAFKCIGSTFWTILRSSFPGCHLGLSRDPFHRLLFLSFFLYFIFFFFHKYQVVPGLKGWWVPCYQHKTFHLKGSTITAPLHVMSPSRQTCGAKPMRNTERAWSKCWPVACILVGYGHGY